MAHKIKIGAGVLLTFPGGRQEFHSDASEAEASARSHARQGIEVHSTKTVCYKPGEIEKPREE